MCQLIINADDCGRNATVNREIKNCIEAGVITSTTVMANMDDFEGAIKLYSEFSNRISFGAHLNLTQGCPLTDPSVFLKYGFCKNKDGVVTFNGMPFRWKYINGELRKAVYYELKAQMEKISKAGIRISHIDSHQHIHFAPCLTPVFSMVANETGVFRIRRPKNFLTWNFHDVAMRGLNAYYMFQFRGMKTTDYFSSVATYIKWPIRQDAIYELMCHPGHDNSLYIEEMQHLREYLSQSPNETLVTYNEL